MKAMVCSPDDDTDFFDIVVGVFLITFLLPHISKLASWEQKQPEDSLFNSYYTEVLRTVLLISMDYSTYSWSIPYNAEC